MFSSLSSLHLSGVVIAVVLNFVLGALWYSPLLVSPTWVKLAKIDIKNPRYSPMVGMLFAVINSILWSVTIGTLMKMTGVATPQQALILVLWLWAAFSFIPTLMRVLFEGRPLGLVWIASGYDLIGFIVIGAAIFHLAL